MLRFTATLLIAASAAQVIAVYSGWASSQPIVLLTTNAFMAGITLLVFRIVSRIKDQIRFTQVYLVSIIIKVLAACSFTIVLILIDKTHAHSNVIFLLILYVTFTIVEVAFLMRAGRVGKDTKPLPRRPEDAK